MATNDSHAEKGARNQALIREVNERIEQVAEDAAHPAFLCECANPDCVDMIVLSVAEYESIRSSPTRFPVKPGKTTRSSSASSMRMSTTSWSRSLAQQERA